MSSSRGSSQPRDQSQVSYVSCIGKWFFTISATWEAPTNKDWLPLVVLCSVAELCLTLCKPMNCSPPDFSVRGIFQARILEWVAISSSRDLPGPGIKPTSLASPALVADSLTLCHLGSTYRFTLFFSTSQFSSVAQSFPTLRDPMNHSMPGLPVHHQLPEFT